MTFHRRLLALAGALLTLAAGVAHAEQDALRARIEQALKQLGPHATVAVRVVSLDQGRVLYEHNADLSLNPASNMKLLTSTTALAKLGPDYRFTTRVLASEKPQGDTLTGDMVLQGGGDPVLELPDLEKLAEAMKALGVRRVTGRLLADDYRYDAERLGNGWNGDDEPFYYSAQISALTLNRNVATVDVSPGATVGDPAQVEVKPIPGYLRVVEAPKTGAAGAETRLSITRARARNEIRVRGLIPLGGATVRDREVTMEEPELWAAEVFRKLLADRGIQVMGATERAPAPTGTSELATHTSRPLSEIAALFNKPSDNLIGEMLLKELGYALRKQGTADAGSEVVEGWLKEIGIDTAGVKVNDGSGLSRLDLVTSRAISDLLIYAHKQPWGDLFVASLPIAGVDGTLRNRFKGTPAEKNVRAKTGSLLHVSALGGYVTGSKGDRRVFSILINQYPGPGSAKRFEDLIGVALATE